MVTVKTMNKLPMCQDGCISTLCCQRWVHLAAKVKNMTHAYTLHIQTHHTKYTHALHAHTPHQMHTLHIYVFTNPHKTIEHLMYSSTIRNLTLNIIGYIMQVSCTPLSQTLLIINSCNDPVQHLIILE